MGQRACRDAEWIGATVTSNGYGRRVPVVSASGKSLPFRDCAPRLSTTEREKALENICPAGTILTPIANARQLTRPRSPTTTVKNHQPPGTHHLPTETGSGTRVAALSQRPVATSGRRPRDNPLAAGEGRNATATKAHSARARSRRCMGQGHFQRAIAGQGRAPSPFFSPRTGVVAVHCT